MAKTFPDLPLDKRLTRGGSDLWDMPQASVILAEDYFDVVSSIAYTLTAVTGVYAVTGKPNTLTYVAGAVAAVNYALTCTVGSYAVTGKASTLSVAHKLAGVTGAYTLTGKATTFSLAHNLSAATGSYALSGQASTFSLSHKLSASTGAYSLAGQAATFGFVAGNINYALACAVGAYSVTGNPSTLSAAHKLTCNTGSYAATGISAILLLSRKLSALAGTYSVAGKASNLLVTHKLSALTGSYSVTGKISTVLVAHQLSVSAGAYGVTGIASTSSIARKLTNNTGSYSLIGSAASLSLSYKLSALSGIYTVAGKTAALATATQPPLYVAADYWQLDYAEGELSILLAAPSAVSTGYGLAYSTLTMAGSASSAVSSTPLLKASMPIIGAGVAQAVCSTGVQVSTAVAGNPVAVAIGSGLTYSTLTMSANGYAISNGVSDITFPAYIAGHAYVSSKVAVEYAQTEYWLEGYAEEYAGSSILVSTAIATSAVASANGQASILSQMPISANGYGNATGLADIKMALSCSANAVSYATSHGITFSTMPFMGAPKAAAYAHCKKIMFVGYSYNLPIGINDITSLTASYNLSSMTIHHDLKTVTPIYSAIGLPNIFDIDSLTTQRNANTLTPQHDIRRLN